MGSLSPFADLLEAVDRLSSDEQVELVEIVRRRVAERGRKRLAAETEEARREFAEGRCRPATPSELIGEILS
jgi:hypothetical protein